MRLFQLKLVNESAGSVHINPKKILSVEERAGATCYVTLNVMGDPYADYRSSRLVGYHVDESAASLLKRLRKQ